jgi:hypothetical protein
MAPLLLVLLLLATFARAWINMASAEAEMRRYYLLDLDGAQPLASAWHPNADRRIPTAVGAPRSRFVPNPHEIAPRRQ